MKKIIKFIAIALAFATLVCAFTACGEKEPVGTPIDETKELKALSGENTEWLNSNPDRGYRTEMTVFLYDTAENDPWLKEDPRAICVNGTEAQIQKSVDFLMRCYVLPENKLTIAYINFDDCNTADQIPEKYFKALDIYLQNCRARGIRVIWRHCYGHTTNKYIANKADLEYLKKVCADEDTMVRHIKQIGEYIGKHLDVIHKVSAGVIGNGEYTASFQYPPVDFNTITDAIVRYMCVPNNLMYSVRIPKYKKSLLDEWKAEKGEDYPYADYIGFNNDCIYGETRKRGAYSSCYQYNHDPHLCTNGDKCFMLTDEAFDMWQWVNETCAYTSQCGEMYTNEGMVNVAKIMTDGFEVIKEMAHHRHTTLSNWHTMGEAGDSTNNVMKHWVENEFVTAEMLDNAGIIYDPNWFTDADGIEMSRNPYEFIRDHLGYRIVADKVKVTGSVGAGTKVNVDMSFKNYGFAAAFFLESGFAVLDKNYNLVSNVKAGDPNKWISLPADYYTEKKSSSVLNDVCSYNVAADLTLPTESGKYYIAFYLKNGLDDYAMLANDTDSVPFEGDGYSILWELDI